jgi:hypothetical protein
MAMRDDEREQRIDRDITWRIEIDLPEEMAGNFRQWWDSQGWWSFRSWHDGRFSPDSEWEIFMSRLHGEAPAKKRPAICDPLNPRAD